MPYFVESAMKQGAMMNIFFSVCLSELFATEHAHVRMLSVLQTVFSRPLEREEIMSMTELATIFPSLDEIIEMHCTYPLQIY